KPMPIACMERMNQNEKTELDSRIQILRPVPSMALKIERNTGFHSLQMFESTDSNKTSDAICDDGGFAPPMVVRSIAPRWPPSTTARVKLQPPACSRRDSCPSHQHRPLCDGPRR